MSTDSIRKRLEALETLYQAPEEPPTRCFFATELFQAAANYGNQSPDRVREDVEQVEQSIAYADALRTEHNLDVIDFAIVLTRARTDHSQTADGVAAQLCVAHWNWDEERHGKSYASRNNRRSREEWETIVAARLAQHGEPSLGVEYDWIASLGDEDVEFLAGIAEHVKAGGLIVDMDAADRARLDDLETARETFMRGAHL